MRAAGTPPAPWLSRRGLALSALLAGLYWLGAQLGFVFSNQGIMTPVWPAAAVALAGAVLFGPGSLWLAVLYVFVDLLGWHGLELRHVGRAWVEPLGVCVSALGVRYLAARLSFDPRLTQLRQVGVLLLLAFAYAGVNAMVLSAGYCGFLRVASCMQDGVGSYWLQSFTGDFFGCMIVTPALLSWAGWLQERFGSGRPWPRFALPAGGRLAVAQQRFLLAASFCLLLAWVAVSVFRLPVSAIGFLVLPLMVWAALQFQPVFVHSTILVTGLVTISLQLTATGISFADPERELSSLLLFLLSLSALTLVVNVIVQEQQSMARALVYRAEQERIELMLQVASDAVLSFDDRGQVSYLNPSAQRVLARAAVTLQQGVVSEILPSPRLRDLPRLGMLQVMARDPTLFSGQMFELEFDADDGQRHTLEVALSAYCKAGQWSATAFMRDVSLRKRNEDALRKTSRELDLILQSAQVGIVHTVDGRYVWANRRFAEMMGYRLENLVGQPTQACFQDETSAAEFRALSQPQLGAGQPCQVQWPLRHHDGSTLWCEMHGNNVDPADASQGAIWSVLDISARKRADTELRHALAHQEELNELKSRFVAMTSHEFRTPLSAILSSTELLEHYGERLPAPEKAGLYQRIQQAVHRMAQMLDDILILGQAEAARLDFRPTEVHLDDFCAELVQEARLGAPPGISIDYQRAGCGELTLDAVLLRRILSNLLSNAIKYSPQGGVVHLVVTKLPASLHFQISDPGIGIPPEDLPRLFESFHRGKNVGQISGTGLGLSIVKKAVQAHAGSIQVSSEIGRGTTFEVRIALSPGATGLSQA